MEEIFPPFPLSSRKVVPHPPTTNLRRWGYLTGPVCLFVDGQQVSELYVTYEPHPSLKFCCSLCLFPCGLSEVLSYDTPEGPGKRVGLGTSPQRTHQNIHEPEAHISLDYCSDSASEISPLWTGSAGTDPLNAVKPLPETIINVLQAE